MHLDILFSKVYEIIRYHNMFYNYNTVISDKTYKVDNSKTIYNYEKLYMKLCDNKKVCREELYSLFFYKVGKSNTITTFFIDHSDKINNIQDFIQLIRSPEFKKYFHFDYFDIETTELDVNILEMDLDEKIKFSLTYLTAAYDRTIDKLIESLCIVYKEIEWLYESEKNTISSFYLYEENYKYVSKRIGEDIENNKCGISLLHPYGWIVTNSGDCIFGYMSNDLIEQVIDYGNISLESIFNLFENDMCRSMINESKNLGVFTQRDMYNILNSKYNIASSSNSRWLSKLYEENILIVIKETKKSTYYKLNHEYFERMKKMVSDYCDFYIE